MQPLLPPNIHRKRGVISGRPLPCCFLSNAGEQCADRPISFAARNKQKKRPKPSSQRVSEPLALCVKEGGHPCRAPKCGGQDQGRGQPPIAVLQLGYACVLRARFMALVQGTAAVVSIGGGDHGSTG